MTLEEATALGHEVRVEHYRAYAGVQNYFPRYWEKAMPHLLLGEPLGKGGITVVYVKLADGRTVFGTARCSEKDNFSRRIGRELALDRAIVIQEEV